jgi:glutathione S-transferase
MPAEPGGFDLDLVTSLAATALRGGLGVVTRPGGRRPPLLFELYEFEGCPYCRLVREALTELDLDALVFPCPKGGSRFRGRVLELGGKLQFPYFVDPNAGRAMYESADIIAYLFQTYGTGELPLHWQWIGLQQLASGFAGLPRASAGRRAAHPPAAQVPAQPLELYSFEASPFARLVRERLSELELPYVLRSCGRANVRDWLPPQVRDALGIEARPETVNRQALAGRAGRITIPYLVDPNSGVEMGEARAIIAYLDRTYG